MPTFKRKSRTRDEAQVEQLKVIVGDGTPNLDQPLSAVAFGLARTLSAAQVRNRMGSWGVAPGISGEAFIKDLLPTSLSNYCFAVFVRAGVNEEHYVHVQVQWNEGRDTFLRALPLFIGETFQGQKIAFRIAAVLARALRIV